jgi:hypothetical protein
MKYLSIRALGYYERVNESATQYAARLLSNKKLPNGKKFEDLADHFTNMLNFLFNRTHGHVGHDCPTYV